MAKVFYNDKQYTPILNGSSIQPILATLAEVLRSLEVQRAQLEAQQEKINVRIAYLEELRDAVYDSKQFLPNPADQILDEEHY